MPKAKKKVVKKKIVKKKPAKKKIVKKKPIKKAKPVSKVLKKKVPARKAVQKTIKKAAKKVIKKAKKPVKAEKGFLGEITHYFPKVRAAVIKLIEPLAVGDKIKVKGHTTDFTQTVTSLQIDRVAISQAKKGDEIGFMVQSRVRRGDRVTKI